jgi:hypothetical protein
MEMRGDADLREPPSQPLEIRVEISPAGEFAADADDFCFHIESRLASYTLSS